MLFSKNTILNIIAKRIRAVSYCHQDRRFRGSCIHELLRLNVDLLRGAWLIFPFIMNFISDKQFPAPTVKQEITTIYILCF
jgi:hypothetical protein